MIIIHYLGLLNGKSVLNWSSDYNEGDRTVDAAKGRSQFFSSHQTAGVLCVSRSTTAPNSHRDIAPRSPTSYHDCLSRLNGGDEIYESHPRALANSSLL